MAKAAGFMPRSSIYVLPNNKGLYHTAPPTHKRYNRPPRRRPNRLFVKRPSGSLAEAGKAAAVTFSAEV